MPRISFLARVVGSGSGAYSVQRLEAAAERAARPGSCMLAGKGASG